LSSDNRNGAAECTAAAARFSAKSERSRKSDAFNSVALTIEPRDGRADFEAFFQRLAVIAVRMRGVVWVDWISMATLKMSAEVFAAVV
jgi:hypothetical protein